jgi:hypothetical protein
MFAYFMPLCNMLLTFCVVICYFSCDLVYFPPYWYIVSRKLCQPCIKMVEFTISSELIVNVMSFNNNTNIKYVHMYNF